MERSPEEVERVASRFLRSGKLPASEATPEFASACEQQIRQLGQRSLDRALVQARRFVRHSATLQPAFQMAALRSLARTAHLSARFEEALGAYVKLRGLVRGDTTVTARIDRALIDIYMYLSDARRARTHAARAMRAFTMLKAESDLAMTQVNYANVLHRQDRHQEAEKLYDTAAVYFKSVGDELSLARCYYNRANALLQLFHVNVAESLYEQSRQIYERHDQALEANDARYGLAWLHMLVGKFHIALRELAECERVYQTIGQPKGAALCVLDRAEVYLGLNLFEDCLHAARMAFGQFTKLHLRYEASKALFFEAKALTATDRQREARVALEKALRGFQKEKNLGFQAAVHLLAAQVSRTPGIGRAELAVARRKFARAQLPLWQAICDLYEATDSKRVSVALGRLARNGAVQTVPHLFASWQTLSGDFEHRKGREQIARRHWRRAADRLDSVRAQLPPLELRTGFGRIVGGSHRRLVASFLAEDPAQAAAWSERLKTAGVWTPSSELSRDDSERSRAQQSLATLASHVASLSRQLGDPSGQRSSGSAISEISLKRLQARVRHDLSLLERADASTATRTELILEDIRRTSIDLPILQFHLTDTDMCAFVHESAATRLVRFPGGRDRLADLLRQWRFILEGELLSPQLKHSGFRDVEQRFFEALGDWLWAPLEISRDHDRVLVIPEGELANLPWQAITKDGNSLSLRHNFLVNPSLRHYLYARANFVGSSSVRLFMGRAVDLPEVHREIGTLSKRTGPDTTLYSPCRRTDWPMAGSDRLWHYAGHAFLREDNPFYSYLSLEDGPFFAADLRLSEAKVGLVTLATCRSGQQVTLPGEESTGLVRSLLEMGARNVIASRWPVADGSTALWMSTFYDRYFDGVDISHAAQDASLTVREQYRSAYHWAAFSIFGAGT